MPDNLPPQNPPASCPDNKQLVDFLLGKLNEQAVRSMAQHLEACLECQENLKRPGDVSDGLIDSLREKPAEEAFLDESAYQELAARIESIGLTWPGPEGDEEDNDAHDASPGDEGALREMLPRMLGQYKLLKKLGQQGSVHGKDFRAQPRPIVGHGPDRRQITSIK